MKLRSNAMYCIRYVLKVSEAYLVQTFVAAKRLRLEGRKGELQFRTKQETITYI